MKKTVLLAAGAMLFAQAGNVSAGDVHLHSVDVREIINVHAKMTELDKQLLKSPDDPSLNQALKELEIELVAKMKAYNAMRRDALEAMPAAGPSQETD